MQVLKPVNSEFPHHFEFFSKKRETKKKRSQLNAPKMLTILSFLDMLVKTKRSFWLISKNKVNDKNVQRDEIIDQKANDPFGLTTRFLPLILSNPPRTFHCYLQRISPDLNRQHFKRKRTIPLQQPSGRIQPEHFPLSQQPKRNNPLQSSGVQSQALVTHTGSYRTVPTAETGKREKEG